MVYALLVILIIAIIRLQYKLNRLESRHLDLVDDYCVVANKLAEIENILDLEPNDTNNPIEAMCFPYKGKNPLNTFED